MYIYTSLGFYSDVKLKTNKVVNGTSFSLLTKIFQYFCKVVTLLGFLFFILFFIYLLYFHVMTIDVAHLKTWEICKRSMENLFGIFLWIYVNTFILFEINKQTNT